METLFIGLDALNPETVDTLRDTGELPNIDELLQKGVEGKLTSTRPPMTPAAWTSIASGVNPGKHGIFDFLEIEQRSNKIVPTDYSQNTYPELWRLFDHFNLDVGVLNYPLVYPPSEAGSFFVSGIPASTTDTIARPESARDILDKHDYHLTARATPDEGAETYYKAVQEQTETQCQCALELIDEYELDVFMTVFMGLDWIQHYLWNTKIDGKDAVQRSYEEMDDVVGRIISAVGDDTNIVLLSDHGAGPIEGELHLNTWLEEQGYLARQKKSGFIDDIAKSLLRRLWEFGTMLPDGVKQRIKQADSESVIEEVKQQANIGQFGMEEKIDWDRTFAFSYGYMGKVNLNSDVNPSSVKVDSDSFNEIRQDLIADLDNLTDPQTDQSIVSTVHTREDIYTGKMIKRAPELQLEINDWKYMIYGDFGDQWFCSPQDRVADHKAQGTIAMRGPTIKNLDECSLDAVDVAPTLLALHDLPLLEEMDGEPKTSFFNFDPLFRRITIEDISNEDSGLLGHGDEVQSRLEDLGYI